MSNNEWNRLLGQRWRDLSPADHEPFKLMALQDKKRFASVSLGYVDLIVRTFLKISVCCITGVCCGWNYCGKASQVSALYL